MAKQSPENRVPASAPAPKKKAAAPAKAARKPAQPAKAERRPAPAAKAAPAPKPARRAEGGGRGALVALACAAALLVTGLVQARPASGNTQAPALRISEVMSANASTRLGESGLQDYIEIENVSGQTVKLAGWSLMRAMKPAQAFVFPDGTLEPGEFALVLADESAQAGGDGTWHAPFRMPAAGEGLTLLDRTGKPADSVTVPALAKDQVYCLDDSGAWALSDFPTPGAANRAGRADGTGEAAEEPEVVVTPGAVEISEVSANNATFFADEDGEYPDYIEVRNTSDGPVSLSGWSLSDNRHKLRRWVFPAVTLPAGGCLAVHCSGTDRKDDPAHLHASFKLNKGGEEVYLTDPDGAVTSAVKVPALSADQAWSLLETGWTRGFSPTPGQPNTQQGAEAAGEEIRSGNGTGVVLSEILASSSSSDDWIELYNGSSSAVDLTGYGLSDNAGRPRKWQFPSGTVIQPGAYLGVVANGTDTITGGHVTTSYRLSADGGYSVTLSDPSGKVLDRLFLGNQYQNMSFGREEGRSGLRYFTAPTPGSANTGESYLGRAAAPVYSVRGGLFNTGDSFSVELSVPSGCRVYYTLDSTDPTESSTPYTEPIPVSGTTILRTRVYGEGYLESYMDTQSYLYDVERGDGDVFVVSLVSDPYNLTSDEAGIMVMGPNALDSYPYGSMNEGANFWMDWEREAHVEIYHNDGSPMLSQECGIKLHGQYSRAEKQQAFKVIARGQYGSNRFPAAIFSKRPYAEYQSFLLRSSGQDSDKTRMRDSVLCALAEGTSVLYQETELAVVYLDGKYWGHYNLRERINAACICQFEGWEGDEDDIDLVKANTNVMQGSNETMAKLLDWVKKNDTNNDQALRNIGSIIDIQNYIEYMAVEMFTGNTDTLNVKRYRNPKADGKWRWVLFDLDWAFDVDTNSVTRWLTPGGMGNGNRTDNTLFIACMKNDTFRDQFLTYLGEQMATTFSTDSILARAKARYEELKPILPDQLERWGGSQSQYESAMKAFINYAQNRPYRILQFLKECKYLNLSQGDMERYFGGVMANVGVTYGEIKKA